MAEPAKCLMDLVDVVDNVPADFDFNALYRLLLPNDPRPHGFIFPSTVNRMPWTPDFAIDHESRTIRLADTSTTSGANPGEAMTTAFQAVVDGAISQDIFPMLHDLHSEYYRVMGADHFVQIERYPSPLFGIISRGAHLTAYVPAPSRKPKDMKIWIAKRSHHIYTYPGKLDTSVAGGVKSTDSPLDCVVAESDEEASLDRQWVRENARATGMVSYMAHNKRNETMQPVVVFVYDLECPPEMELKPRDDEVEEFRLMTVDEVTEAMLQWRFKSNCCLVMIDFFVRHGIIHEGNEIDYLDLVTRLRRQLPVPLAPRKI